MDHEREAIEIEEELEKLQTLAFTLVQDLAIWPNTTDITSLQERAQPLALLIKERLREDRCYRCGETKKNSLLGGDITNPCLCTNCHMQDHSAAKTELYRSWENR